MAVIYLLAAVAILGLWAFDRMVLNRPCPSCGKRVKAKASVCAYCHSDLT